MRGRGGRASKSCANAFTRCVLPSPTPPHRKNGLKRRPGHSPTERAARYATSFAWPTTNVSNVYSGTRRPIFGPRSWRDGGVTAAAACGGGGGASPFVAATTTRTAGAVPFVAVSVSRIRGKKCRVTHSWKNRLLTSRRKPCSSRAQRIGAIQVEKFRSPNFCRSSGSASTHSASICTRPLPRVTGKSCRLRATVIHTWGQRGNPPPPHRFPPSSTPPCTASPTRPPFLPFQEGSARNRQEPFAIQKKVGAREL